MKNLTLTALTLLLAAAVASAAHHEQGDHATSGDQLSFKAAQIENVSARVTAIDLTTRRVTLQRTDGEIVEITAPADARNLDQVEIGDLVVATYVESLTVEVVASGEVPPGVVGMTAIERAEKGEKPGMIVADTEIVAATVVEIDLDMNTFKLKEADGTVEEYKAMNPDNLRRAKVGDLVVITFSESMAISVESGGDR